MILKVGKEPRGVFSEKCPYSRPLVGGQRISVGTSWPMLLPGIKVSGYVGLAFVPKRVVWYKFLFPDFSWLVVRQ